MTKLKLHTPDLTAANVERIAALFPNCVTEATDETGKLKRAIDFDLLKQELSADLVEGPQERYRLDWPGKREALALANTPVALTLRPCREESVDFETTKNLYIEGDNLDALKLLQETYLGKVKMIYIDPPYNTGNDFIYEDDFTAEKEAYQRGAGEKDVDGNRMIDEERWRQNTASNGRFHSDWLSMIYSRLKLARSLLRDDGVICISVDDNEQANARRLCDEVFGPSNFEGHIHWRRRHNQPNDPTKMIGLVAEHVIVYAKNKEFLKTAGVGKIALTGDFLNPDNDPRGPWASKPWKVGSDQSGSRYIIVSPSGIHLDDEWMGEKDTYEALVLDKRIVWPKRGSGTPRKKYFQLEREEEGQCATNWWSHETFGHNQGANDEMTSLMGVKNVFSNPKPKELIAGLIAISNSKSNSIILDFFSGSATTAHAVMQLNAEDGGKRRHIMVQLPEPCDAKSEAFKAGYKTIAEIGKERIRRAGKKILAEWQAKQAKEKPAQGDLLHPNNFEPITHNSGASPPDIGFRVLKIDDSNMKDVYYAPDEVKQSDLLAHADNLKEGRTHEDLLFQVLVDWGVDLALPITRESVAGKTIFFVDGNALTACFEPQISEELVKNLAKRQPMRVVFRDGSYGDDSAKINVEQIFKHLSPGTEIKSL
jgi:adenine-specific DNA-methyltransferase